MAFLQRLSTIIILTSVFLLITQVSSFKLVKRQAAGKCALLLLLLLSLA